MGNFRKPVCIPACLLLFNTLKCVIASYITPTGSAEEADLEIEIVQRLGKTFRANRTNVFSILYLSLCEVRRDKAQAAREKELLAVWHLGCMFLSLRYRTHIMYIYIYMRNGLPLNGIYFTNFGRCVDSSTKPESLGKAKNENWRQRVRGCSFWHAQLQD